jgi:H+-transporting ATPase
MKSDNKQPESTKSKAPDKPDTSKSKVPAKPAPEDDLKTLPMPEVEKKLESSADGLTQAEAQKRLTQYGPNELEEKKTNMFLKFLTYFWGPIPWMIEVAVILSAVARHWPDFFIILVLLFANAIVGFWEERQAGNAIEALKAKLAIKARVKRDGKWVTPPARELVPGDVIRMRLGDIVPADARLLPGDEISVDQSALTGESLPATRKAGQAIFSGSIIRRGEIDALVYATGTNTYFGKTAKLVEEAHTVSHFQKAVLKIGNYLIILAVALVAVIITIALFRGDPILSTLQFALVLTVAAIPVAMPTVLSVTMAVGARLLAKKQAIVSKLVAIEELAGVDVLCADKTGTLTQNKLTLGDPFSVNNIPAEQVILDGALASRAENNDTIDLAVLGGMKNKDALKEYEVVHFQPFDPVHKRTEASVKSKDGKTFKVTKGAPQVILALSANLAQVKSATDKAVNDFAAKGFRALGVARADGDGQWQFVGVLPLFDPPRDDAKETIATAVKMGVKIKMVTGDALAIAKETAQKLNMGTNILDAASLGDSKKEESSAVAESIENADGFAQVFPEHKYHIIDVLQKRGHIVGMTGDGVNDAPALKKADCGIAVSGATDAARAAASIVLLTPGLSVIIDAIKESRRIFQRMNSYSMYRIAETLRVLFFMTLAIIVFNFYPVTAVMIVMIALLNDGAILSIAYDNVHYKDKPEAWDMRTVLSISTVLGIIGVVAAFGLFYLAERVFHLDRAHAQTMMYLKLSVAGHLTIFLTRTRGPFWSIKPAKILWMAVLGTQTVATLIAVYGLFMTPLGWGWAGFVWGYAIVWALINDRIKLLAYKILDRKKVKASTSVLQKTEDKTSSAPEAKAGVTPENKADAKPDALKAGTQPGAKEEPEVKAKSKSESKDESKADVKPGATPEAKAEPKPEANAEPKPEAKAQAQPDSKSETKSDTTPDPKPEAAAAAKPEDQTDSKPEAKAEPKPEDKADSKPKAKTEAQPDSKADAKSDITPDLKPDAAPTAKTEDKAETKPKAESEPETNANPRVDFKPQIAKRAYEIHEKEGNKEGSAGQDWAKAEGEIRNKESGAATELGANEGSKQTTKTVDSKPEASQKDKAGAKPDEVKAASEPEAKKEPEAKENTPANLTPQLVKRVHELYEQLGREEVKAVEDLEKAAKSTIEKHE